MANYDANIRVNADTKGAESQLTKLERTLNKLSDFTLKLDSRGVQAEVSKIGQSLRGIAERGALGGLTLSAGKATTALGGVAAKFGILGTAAASAGATINSALNGVPAVVGDILNQVGQIPSAMGLAAVAAMAFAPQLTKAAAGAVKLGATIDNAVGAGTVNKIAEAVDGIGQLNVELEATKASFEDLIAGSTLNQLNRLLADAVKQSGAFHSSTEEAVGAAERLVAVQREQAAEQKAINDLVRKAQGLRPENVENRATNTYRTVQRRKQFEVEQQNRLNAELAEYQRLAEEVAAQTKRWADNIDRISRSSNAGALGSSSQLRTRLQDFRENRNSAEIARQRSAELLAQEAALRGSNYSLGQVPARGELLPGGNTATAQTQYRSMLNEQARIRAAAADALTRAETTLLSLQARTLQTENSISAVKRQQQSIDERSIAIAKERNRLLMQQFRAEQRNPNYGQPGNPGSTLDRRSRLVSLRNRRAQGEQFGAQAENIALGVGFPLLFGGGVGSVAGAGIGSFFGKGFGGQILGGAIGQAIDQFITQINDLGKALLKPTQALRSLSEASLITSRALESTLTRLEEAGFVATANAAAQRDFANAIGPDGAKNLLALGDAADRGSRAFAQAVARMQSQVAGPLGAIQGRIARGGEISNLQAQGGDLIQRLRATGRTQQASQLQATFNPFASVGKSQDQLIAQYQAAIKKAQDSLPPIPVKLDAKQVREELTNALSKQLDALDTTRALRNQVVAQQRAQEDADRQRYELVAASERTIADLRRSIEERVTQQRLANIQRENELLNVQADIRLQSLRNANIPLRNRFTNDQVSSAANAVADYLEQEQQIQNQIDQQKRDTALEIQRLSIETEQYKLQVATQVARLNEDNAKRVAEINRGIRRANADQDTRRFALEKQLADIKLKGLQAEFALLSQQAGAFQNPQIQSAAAQGFQALKQQREELAKLQGPGALREIGGVGNFGASTSGIDATAARATQLLGNIQAARTALLDLVRQGNFETLKAQLDNALDKPLQKAANDAQNVWDALTGKGLGGQSTGAAQRNATLDEFTNQLRQLQAETKNVRIKELLQGYIDTAPGLALVADELRVTTDILGDLNSKYIELQDQLQAISSPYGELTQVQQVRNQLLREGISLESSYAQEVLRQAGAVDALQQQVRVATQLQDVWRGVGNAMGEAMTTGMASVVNGTQNAQQVFATFLQSIADALMSAAANMIATYVTIGLARAFAFGGSPSPSSGPELNIGDALKYSGLRANGGPVAGGMPYIVGENGPELFVPGVAGRVVTNQQTEALMASRSALSTKQSNGSAGSAFADNRDALSATATTTRERNVERYLTSGATSTEIKYSRVGTGDLPFVTEQDMLQATRLAAQEGAKLGQQRTLAALRSNPSTRRSVGV